MEANVKKVTALVKQVRYMEIEISEHLGFDMPRNIDEVVELHNAIKNDPSTYITNEAHWDLELQEVTDIKFT